MKSWKSSSLPLCGVAVISRKWRVSRDEQLAEPVALGVLHLAAEVGGRHLVRLVADDEVPVGLLASFACTSSLRLSLSRRQIDQVVLGEPVAGARRLELVVGQDLEGQAGTARYSSSCHCSTRLPGQTIRQRCRSPRSEQLLDEQPGHDRLARAGVVGQQEAQRLARQHLAVDGGDLVRQRLDERGVDGEERVEEVGQADALRLGDQPEQRAVAVEAPRPARARRSPGVGSRSR